MNKKSRTREKKNNKKNRKNKNIWMNEWDERGRKDGRKERGEQVEGGAWRRRAVDGERRMNMATENTK